MDEEVSPEIQRQRCRGRCDEDDDTRNRKKCRFWKKFSPVCVRKQKQEKSEDDPPEGALQAMSANAHRKRRRFTFQTWPMFDKFLARTRFRIKDGEKHSKSFTKKLQRFLSRGGRGQSSGVGEEKLEDTKDETSSKSDEGRSSSVGQADEFPKSVIDDEERHADVLTVTAEMSSTADSMFLNAAEERHLSKVPEEDLMEAGDGPESTQTDVTANEPNDDVIPMKNRHSAGVMLDSDDLLSTSTISSEEVFEVPSMMKTSHTHQPSTNDTTDGPTIFQYNRIRIELVPPDSDDNTQEDDGWENQNHCQHHLLPVFSYSESQLVRTARTLVQTVMRAAVDQLTKEQQSASACVHREPQGC